MWIISYDSCWEGSVYGMFDIEDLDVDGVVMCTELSSDWVCFLWN